MDWVLKKVLNLSQGYACIQKFEETPMIRSGLNYIAQRSGLNYISLVRDLSAEKPHIFGAVYGRTL